VPNHEIRRARVSDARHIAGIYNHYVRTSTATFDTAEKTEDDRACWLQEHDDSHPVLVAVVGDRIVGWGAITAWGRRPAYRHTVELAVYLSPDATGDGIGPSLLDALIDSARDAGHHVLLAQIVADNEPSLKMAERAGFRRAGTLAQVGRKFDRWLDVALMELILDDEVG
jgi:phosphinothricin acetyltransferase